MKFQHYSFQASWWFRAICLMVTRSKPPKWGTEGSLHLRALARIFHLLRALNFFSSHSCSAWSSTLRISSKLPWTLSECLSNVSLHPSILPKPAHRVSGHEWLTLPEASAFSWRQNLTGGMWPVWLKLVGHLEWDWNWTNFLNYVATEFCSQKAKTPRAK